MFILAGLLLIGVVATIDFHMTKRRYTAILADSTRTILVEPSDGEDIIVGADGEIHRPGCRSAAPPVKVMSYNADKMGNQPLCPECNR